MRSVREHHAQSDYDGEPDYSIEVEKIFEKFRRGAPENYRVRFTSRVEMNHVEAKILDMVAKLNPGVFLRLNEYRMKYDGKRTFRIIKGDPERSGFGEDLYNKIFVDPLYQ